MNRTIEALIQDSHDRAMRKGWWDDCYVPCPDHPGPGCKELDPAKVADLVPEKVLLIRSEISEAVECYRKGEMETKISLGACGFECCCDAELGKPEGFWVEIADAVIRTADLMGALGCTYETPREWDWDFPGILGALEAFNCFLTMSHDLPAGQERRLCIVIDASFTLAAENGVNLWDEIERKAKYNETRPYRHGGRRA